MSSASTFFVLPGQKVGSIGVHSPANGTYLSGSDIRSTCFGRVSVSSSVGSNVSRVPPPSSSLVSVISPSRPLFPETGRLVIGRVTRVNARYASVQILGVSVNDVDSDAAGRSTLESSPIIDPQFLPLKHPFAGIIRLQDVSVVEMEKLTIFKCFRPGDIVIARVLSLGDRQVLFLTVASNELGVICARSVHSHPMLPVSWTEMVSPISGVREPRKCAKI